MRLSAKPLLLLSLVALVGCNTPVEAYTSFHALVQRGDEGKAYKLLSQPTQKALEARAQAAAQASSGAIKPDAARLFFSNVPPPADVTGVSLVKEEGGVATVRVNSARGQSDVRMVREPSGWKVDLSESLQP